LRLRERVESAHIAIVILTASTHTEGLLTSPSARQYKSGNSGAEISHSAQSTR